MQLHFAEGTSGRPSGEVLGSFFLSLVCSCVQVFTQVTTQGGRQYQVVVLISVPSIFVILLEGGILVDPGEIREGIFGNW